MEKKDMLGKMLVDYEDQHVRQKALEGKLIECLVREVRVGAQRVQMTLRKIEKVKTK